MTIASPIELSCLTYEEYIAEPEMMARYDIIDGVRVMMMRQSVVQVDVALNVAMFLRGFQKSSQTGRAMIAPYDVLILLDPLRKR